MSQSEKVKPRTIQIKLTSVVASSKIIGSRVVSEFSVVVITDSASKTIEVTSGVDGESVVFTKQFLVMLYK